MTMNSKEKALMGLVGSLVIVSVFLMSYDGTSFTSHPPQTVPYVNVTRYLGVWWEQARIPAGFEKGCVDTFATYSLINQSAIKVNNTCTRDGKTSSGIATGYIEDKTNSKLKVVFNPYIKLGGQYWIVKLGDRYDYEYSVVSSPDYRYLWILSREKKLNEQTYQ